MNFSCKANVRRIKSKIPGISLFYLSLYIPIALMAYFPQWYIFNCKFHHRFNLIGYSNSLKSIDELTVFFLHKNLLSGEWSGKEKVHLGEVRDIFDILAIIAFLCIVLLIVSFDRSKISTCASVNLVIILSLLVLLPFFKTFWANIFHPLVFDNDLWKNNYLDRSYYIMPGIFFKHSLIFLIALSSLLNGILWLSFKGFKQKADGVRSR